MDHEEEMFFEEFIAAQMRNKGISPKKLSEMTGIAQTHIENMVHGNFEDMPSTPYFHGYLIRVGKVLGFDGEEWWGKIKEENEVKNSGPSDALPKNRFVRRKIPKSYFIAGGIFVILIIYAAFAFPRIVGRPTLVVAYPSESPFITSSSSIIISGTVKNADALYLNNTEEILIAPDGTWEKIVFLSGTTTTEPIQLKISAKKFLGGETEVTKQIIYEPSAQSNPSSSLPVIHTTPETPATGTFFD